MLKSVAILSPVYNENETINFFLEELLQVKTILEKKYDIHIYLVDDGSNDGTFDRDFLSFKRHQVRVVKLKKNIGHQSALFAGLQVAKTHDYIVVLDSDLQDPPKYILEVVDLLNDGLDLVMTQRINRYDPIIKKFFAFLYYRYLKIIFQKNIVLDSGDFWGVTKQVAQEILEHNYRQNIYFRGLLPNLRQNFGLVKITRNQRLLGRSKYGLLSMIKLGYTGIINSSINLKKIFIKYALSIIFINSAMLGLITFLLNITGMKDLDYKTYIYTLIAQSFIILGISVILYLRMNNSKSTIIQIEEVKYLS